MSEQTAIVTRRPLIARPGVWLTWFVVIFFFVNLAGLVGSVVVSSLYDHWFDTWWPQVFRPSNYSDAWHDYALKDVLTVTLEVSFSVVAISALVGVPAAYVLARRSFPGKQLVTLAFLLPILVPPIAYGIPLATVLFKYHLAGTITGVVLANLVPSVPFVVLTMTPFIEQIDPKVEAAARMCGATTLSIFTRILTPLLIPGILAASILVLVRTVAMFELTFLTAGNDTQTLIVELYHEMSGAGIRRPQTVDAEAVIYMLMMMVLLVIALFFVNPTQLVARVAADKER